VALMLLSRESLERIAVDTGYQPAPLEKVVMLGDLAGDIARHPILKDALALKGGTALNLGFGPPSRLSVDLDFNYIGHLEREGMLEDRPKLEEAIVELATRKGYQVQQSADTFAGRKFYCAYRSMLGQVDRVEIDVNYLFRLPLEAPSRRALWQPGEMDQPSLLMVGMSELIVGKLLALLDRLAIRDVWDVGRLPEIAPDLLGSRSFRAIFIAMSATLNHPLHQYDLSRMKGRISAMRIDQDLVPLLTGADAQVAADVIDRAWDVVAPLLALSEAEYEYVEAVSHGDLRLDLLFPDDAKEAARLSKHPALEWKIQNVRAKQWQ